MLRIGIQGASGRMGQEIIRLAEEMTDIKVAATIDPFGKTSARVIEDVDPDLLDGVIDFSTPKATLSLARWCVKHKKFLVCGTTGLKRSQVRALQGNAKKIPLLWAANMSLGVVALKKALSSLAILEGYDFQIEEIHHRHKKDNPSGTALSLQNELASVLGKRLPAPLAIRGGGIRGIHRVLAMGEGEVLSFEHIALDRSIFARGALQAAQWLCEQKRGFFGIEDIWQPATRKRS